MKRTLLIALPLLLVACNIETEKVFKDELSTPMPAGTYVSQSCFLNKLATQDPEVPVYTRGTLSIDEQGVGTSTHQLYLDEACNGTPDAEGSMNIELSYAGELGDVSLYRVVQEDPAVADDAPVTYWFAASRSGDDFYADMEFRNGASGPYLSRPRSSDVAAFAADPEDRGVHFVAD
jgi:hypothetical protein